MDDILITHATVVTVDSSNRILRDAAIAIRGREIVAIGPTEVVSDDTPLAQAFHQFAGKVALAGALRQVLAVQGAVVPPIRVQRVAAIPRTVAGKASLIKSNLSQSVKQVESLAR